ncbi:MAG: hypothetical protein IK152_04835 [Lachnospiraceae bacterium]|nr:hypothetical protein [Lachnospiraceae bacterium]
MKAVMFVNGIEEMDKVIILMTSVSLDFDFKVVDSFEFLMTQFEKEKVDIFICQLGLTNCKALELLQLARMYNPDVINIATGTNDCVDELVETFNSENLFRFISMPWLYKDDIINPIHEAIDSIHENIQKEYDIKALEEDAQVLKGKVNKLREKNPVYERLFVDGRELLEKMISQNYFFSSATTKDEDTEFALFAYDTFVMYYYNNIGDLNSLLHELVNRYRNPEEGRFFTVKHSLAGTVKDEVKSRIIFILYVLNAFVAANAKEYKINAQIGNVDNHYLLKYEFFFPENHKNRFISLRESFNYKMLKFYIDGNCAKSDIKVTDLSIQCKIIVA